MQYDELKKQASEGPLTYTEELRAEFSAIATKDYVIAGIPAQSAQIMGMLGQCRANAKLLIHCWNNFHDLLESLRTIVLETSINPDMKLCDYFQSFAGKKALKVLREANIVKDS